MSVDGPSTLTIASARMNVGTVWNASVIRISTSSTRPPRKPARVPTAMPMPRAPAAAASPTVSETRAPWTSIDQMSRPNWSVPERVGGVRQRREHRLRHEVERVAGRDDRRRDGDGRDEDEPAEREPAAPGHRAGSGRERVHRPRAGRGGSS